MNNRLKCTVFVLMLVTIASLWTSFPPTQGKVNGEEVDPPMDKIRLYKEVSPAVVEVLNGQQLRGSGFIACGKEKVVVTVLGVVGILAPENVSIRLIDGTTLRVSAIEKDEEQYTAILPLIWSKPGNLPCLLLADYDQLKVGQDIMFVGSQLGFTGTPAWGTISGLDRTVQNTRLELPEDFICKRCTNMVTVDATTNSGNSGAPAFNSKGEVTGVDVFTIRLRSNDTGIPFLISAKSIANALAKYWKDAK